MQDILRYSISAIGGFCLGSAITSILTGEFKKAAIILLLSTVTYGFGNYYEQYINMKKWGR
ncbi:MAG: hypothetical protein KH031_26975 [Clostridiales bacterium]|nr:hypothetical protein [Clostridiales bacterium]